MSQTAQHILIPFHDLNSGGTERIALTLAKHWLDAGRRVTLLCGSKTGGLVNIVDPRIDLIELDPPMPETTFSRLWLGRRMAQHLGKIRPDVVFVQGNFLFGLAWAFKRAAPRLPIVAKVSNPLLPPLPRGLTGLARKLLRMYVRPIDQFVYIADELANVGRIEIPQAAQCVIAEPNLSPDRPALPRSSPPEIPLILVIARLEAQKNVGLAIEAFALLQRRRECRLLILGEGSERSRLEAIVTRLGVGAAVSMPGYTSDVATHLSHASLLLLSSRFEGYPAVVVEALAADVPVVSTACSPALRTLIASPTHGRIVAEPTAEALAGAMEQVIEQPFTSGGLRPATVAHHDAAASARAYLAQFDQVVTPFGLV
ncbi:MAG: glycosyltransferase [Novosphingobium sp.]